MYVIHNMDELQKRELQTYEQSLDDMYHLAESQTTTATKLYSDQIGSDMGKKTKEYNYGYEMRVEHFEKGTLVWNTATGVRYEFKDRNEAHRFAKGHYARYKAMY